ncbi:MAG TPA: acyl-CoA dehydrogenase [Quisquiliibacterium sp.]|nr:acyl-CoA dehydrogenase [Quisquiliibacterium sp.]
MALVLNEEQTMLRDSAQAFLAENGPIAQLRKLRDGRDATGFSTDLWRGFASMGFAGALVPEAHGGLGLGPVEAGAIMEAIGRNLTASPFLSTSVLGVTALLRGGNAGQQAAWLPKIAGGEVVVALAADESAKHRPNRIALKAAAAAGGFALSGAKTFVVDGHVADLLIVAARTSGAPDDADGVTLFLVDPKAKGVGVERTVMVDAHNAARIAFDGVQVGADAVLGSVGGGRAVLDAVLDAGRAALASELVGAADEAFERTLAYLKERKQFGRVIGEFQALQHRAAHLYSEIEVTRAAVIKAQQSLAEDPSKAARLVSLAKARAGMSATLAVQEGVQMHGGMGMTDEFDIGLFMKRVRVAQELLGDSDFHADRLASLAGY